MLDRGANSWGRLQMRDPESDTSGNERRVRYHRCADQLHRLSLEAVRCRFAPAESRHLRQSRALCQCSRYRHQALSARICAWMRRRPPSSSRDRLGPSAKGPRNRWRLRVRDIGETSQERMVLGPPVIRPSAAQCDGAFSSCGHRTYRLQIRWRRRQDLGRRQQRSRSRQTLSGIRWCWTEDCQHGGKHSDPQIRCHAHQAEARHCGGHARVTRV